MPKRPPSVIRRIMQAADHPHLHLPQDAIDKLPPRARKAVAKRREMIEELKSEKSAIVARVGRMIGRVRDKMLPEGRGDEFVRFRIAGSAQYNDGDGSPIPAGEFSVGGFEPGGVFGQPEDAREAFVQAVLEREGL